MIYFLYNINLRGDYMKKHILILIIISFLLIGCSSKVNSPYEVSINNKTVSYYDNAENIPDTFNALEISIINAQDKGNNILVNKDNLIRCFSITSNDVITYNQISVGDSIDLVKDKFSYEKEYGNNNYTVIFKGASEQDPDNENKEDDWICINYVTDGSTITQIQIYDVKFGRELR